MDGAFWIWGGSLFQMVGAINEKTRSPYRGLVRGPWINCIEEDERRNLAEEEDRRETRSWRYLGGGGGRLLVFCIKRDEKKYWLRMTPGQMSQLIWVYAEYCACLNCLCMSSAVKRDDSAAIVSFRMVSRFHVYNDHYEYIGLHI